MKQYIFKAHTVSGRQGEIKLLHPTARATQDLLKLGFIEEVKQPEAEKREVKVIEPTETKAKPKRKPRKRKSNE